MSYEKEIIDSLDRATGLKWELDWSKPISKPAFVQTGAKFHWWSFVCEDEKLREGIAQVEGITANGVFVYATMWSTRLIATIISPDYANDNSIDKIAEAVKEKFL